MPGDPQQCRRYAIRCRALAQRARRPGARANFAAMAETWTKLAAQIESDQALFLALMELEQGEPNYALPLALHMPLNGDPSESLFAKRNDPLRLVPAHHGLAVTVDNSFGPSDKISV